MPDEDKKSETVLADVGAAVLSSMGIPLSSNARELVLARLERLYSNEALLNDIVRELAKRVR